MIEADLVERGRRRERRNVAADAGLVLVCAQHHRDRVPPNQALDAPFDFLAAGKRHFLVGRQRVDVRRVGAERQPDAATAGVLAELLQQLARARGPVALQHVIERIEPLSGFNRLEIGDVACGDVFHQLARPFNLDALQRRQIRRQLGLAGRILVELQHIGRRRRSSAEGSSCRVHRRASWR